MNKITFERQFEEIQQDRKGVVDSSVYPGIKELVSEIYPEEAHFIYELLQNAEDAGADSVYFEIRKDMLVFRHNGSKQFDSEDVDSITNIAKSTKKENFVQAGKFGIGFKSVYAFTDTPSIYCDTVCFKIEKLRLPLMIDDLEDREKGWTEFHFPFDSSKISATNAKEKIKQGLIEVETATLLFLNNIKKLEYKVGGKTLYSVVKETDGRLTSCYSLKNGKQIGNTDFWMRFTRDSKLNGKNIQVDIAFPLQKSNKDDGFDFAPGTDKVCIKFLARNEKSNLRFFINAPFGCTPSRDTVNKDDKANIELIRQLSILMEQALAEICAKDLMSDAFLENLPLPDDNIPAFYMPLVITIRDSFKNKKRIPTVTEGKYVTADNGIMSSRNVIDKVFTQYDIQLLYQSKNLYFVKNYPVITRAYRFLKSLEIKELTPENILVQMTNIISEQLQNFFQSKDDTRLSDIYAFLFRGLDSLNQQAERLEEYRKYGIYSHYSRMPEYSENVKKGVLGVQIEDWIRKIKTFRIVKTRSNEFTYASNTYFEEKGVEVPDGFLLVKKSTYKKDAAKKFLTLLGTKTFSIEELKEYRYQNEISQIKQYLREIEDDGLKDSLDIARKILSFLKNHDSDEVQWKDYNIVEISNKNNSSRIWKKIGECYLDAPLYEETGFRFAEHIHGRHLLSERYNDLEDEEKDKWIDFLKGNGVLWEIHVERVDYGTGFISGFDRDYQIDNLGRYLALKKVELARYIWKLMISGDHWYSFYGSHQSRLNRNRMINERTSSVLNCFINSAWVPDREGIFRMPRLVSRSTIDSTFTIDESNGFLKDIKFGEKAKQIEEEERLRNEKKRLEESQQVDAALRLGFESPEDVLASKENSRKIEELKKLGIDIDELLEKKRYEKKERERETIENMISARKDESFKEVKVSDKDVPAVKNPDRRKDKLESEMEKDSQEETRTVSIKKKETASKEEKAFLKEQYDGECQICRKHIVKRDGSRYFEAINLLDTSKLEKIYQKGLSNGWNSLCLCPNCAAEYSYGAVSLYDFKDKVISTVIDRNVDKFIEFNIRMQGEDRTLIYTPVHMFHLQTALNHFDALAKSKDEASLNEVTKTRSESFMLSTNIRYVPSGDRCPVCGKKGQISDRMEVRDKEGNAAFIKCRKCNCGVMYVTKNLYAALENKHLFNIVFPESKERPNQLPESDKETKKEKRTVIAEPITSRKKKNTIIIIKGKQVSQHKIGKKVCKMCGKQETFKGTGMCWECYKDYMQSVYD